MLINLRNALMAGKRLPYDAEVEYLESSGTQYIDTGYSFNSATDKVELVFELLTTTPNYKWIFGAYDTKRFAIGSGDNVDRRTFGYNASTSYISSTYYTNGAHILLADSTGASIDGHRFFGFADFSTISHILLYTIPLDPSSYCSNARIWSYKHYRNGVLVRDYIPVRKGTVGYLYDRVSGKLFGNAGTGDFVLGPDVVPVEWLSNNGLTQYIDTGVIGGEGLRVVMDITPMEFRNDRFAMAAYDANARIYPAYQYRASASQAYWGGGYGAYLSGSTPMSIGLKVLLDAEFTSEYQILKIDGVETERFAKTGFTGTPTRTLYIFGVNGTGGINSFLCKIGHVQIYQNGMPTRAFVPIRVGTDATSWEGAMMDVLTRRIDRNAGTGAFTYGNDLKYPIPAE